jgi:hypothetical protein
MIVCKKKTNRDVAESEDNFSHNRHTYETHLSMTKLQCEKAPLHIGKLEGRISRLSLSSLV